MVSAMRHPPGCHHAVAAIRVMSSNEAANRSARRSKILRGIRSLSPAVKTAATSLREGDSAGSLQSSGIDRHGRMLVRQSPRLAKCWFKFP